MSSISSLSLFLISSISYSSRPSKGISPSAATCHTKRPKEYLSFVDVPKPFSSRAAQRWCTLARESAARHQSHPLMLLKLLLTSTQSQKFSQSSHPVEIAKKKNIVAFDISMNNIDHV